MHRAPSLIRQAIGSQPWERNAGTKLGSVCVVSGFIAYATSMLPNSRRLNAYRAMLSNLPHPSDTSIVAARAKVGWLVFPRPEECDFLVVEVRRFTGTRESLVAHYAVIDAVVAQPDDGHLVVGFVDEQRFQEPCEDHVPDFASRSICNWITSTKVDRARSDVYVLYLLLEGRPASKDLRCLLAG